MAGVITLTTDFGGRDAAGHLVGRVVHVDGFGNLITDIRGATCPPGRRPSRWRAGASRG